MDSADGDWVWVRRPIEQGRQWTDFTAAEEEEEERLRPLKVVFASPAEHFTDAAPIGNGSLGAMVWGGVAAEKLQLNLDTLWTGVPGKYTDPNVPSALAVVRELVDERRFVDATKAASGLLGGPTEVYQPLGDINLVFDTSSQEYTCYKRELDLHTATVQITYNIGEVEYTREHFCSNPHQTIVSKISADKSGYLSFTLSLDSQLDHNVRVINSNEMIMEGTCPGQTPTVQQQDGAIGSTGIKFAAVLNLKMGGSAARATFFSNQKLKIDDADWVVLLVTASSSFNGPFVNPVDSKLDPVSAAIGTLNISRNVTFSQLKAAHLKDYQGLFHRVSLQLSQAPKTEKGNLREDGKAMRTTAERVNSFHSDEDPSLIELLFQYGRYLLISSSQPGTQVSNLQGIWNQDLKPTWEASPHLNINLQMNYWPALPCNLGECQEPLFDFITSLAVNGTETAKVNYQASGWVAHHDTDIWAKSSAYYEDAMYAWPMGGAWLCMHLWEHYQYSLDKEFLENTAYPLLEGCALFLADWLIEGTRGYLETNPSTSPEHSFIAPGGGDHLASVSYSTTMDISIIRDIFLAVISSSEVLGKSDSTLVKRLKKALPRLPPIRIARDRTIMEWAQDFGDPEVHHRHLSHLFGLYPGHTITMETNPEICNAIANSLYKRGQDGPGWSTAWKMALWARLLNSENAYKMVLKIITLVPPGVKVGFEGGLYSNLWTAHPPFQIDANFGFTAAVAEMLLQSTLTDLYLLPALPRDKWPRGSVKGLRARGNVTVNICWEEGRLREALLWSDNGSSIVRLHYDEQIAVITISGGKAHKFNEGLQCIEQWPTLE